MKNRIGRFLSVFLFLIFSFHSLQGRLVESSSPYLTGDTFRSMCDHSFDEVSSSFHPDEVRAGDCIFVKTDMLEGFFEQKHPYIQVPYIIISHNSDDPAPGAWAHFLEDPKIIAWFAQNAEVRHPKLHPIPIGIDNKMYNFNTFWLLDHYQGVKKKTPKDCLVYMNFSICTSPGERGAAYRYFSNVPFCTIVTARKSWQEYLFDLVKSRFVVSPRGNGWDCLRTWESLYMGSFPIVKRSNMDAMYEGLPVVIVDSWDEVTEDFLNKKYEEFQKTSFTLERMYFPYWEAKISRYRLEARKAAEGF